MHSFYHAVGFGVVGRSLVTRGTKELVEGCPEEGCKEGTSVGRNVLWDAESGDTCREEGSSTVGRCFIDHGHGFRPAVERSTMVKRYL